MKKVKWISFILILGIIFHMVFGQICLWMFHFKPQWIEQIRQSAHLKSSALENDFYRRLPSFEPFSQQLFFQKCLFFILNTLYTICYNFISVLLILLVRNYQKMIFFSKQNNKFIMSIGILFIVNEFFNSVLIFIGSYLITHKNKDTHYYIHIPQMSKIMIGLLILLIGWIMVEGLKYKEENSLTI